MVRRIWKKLLICLLLISVIMPLGVTSAYAASVPGLNAKITKKNVLALTKKYDKDGAFLLQPGRSTGDFMVYFSGSRRITSGLDTAVHEMCHGYTWTFAKNFNSEAIYIGNKKCIQVPYTDVYRSKKMAGSVPARCRTMRFSTYVSEPDPNLSSDVKGAYGLLNEFSAYSWGMHNTLALYKYFARYSPTMDTWQDFINSGANNRLAYAEFKYYILHYLYYAKKHYPAVYKKILANKNFRKAYRSTEKRFAKQIKTFEKDLKKIKKAAEAKGYYVDNSNGHFYIGYSGLGLFEDDYLTLKKELSKQKYTAIHKKLLK